MYTASGEQKKFMVVRLKLSKIGINHVHDESLIIIIGNLVFVYGCQWQDIVLWSGGNAFKTAKKLKLQNTFTLLEMIDKVVIGL